MAKEAELLQRQVEAESKEPEPVDEVKDCHTEALAKYLDELVKHIIHILYICSPYQPIRGHNTIICHLLHILELLELIYYFGL